MTSTSSANGSTHSLSAGPATAGNGSSGGMEELLPLVLQLTNAESVSGMDMYCDCLCHLYGLRCVLIYGLYCIRIGTYFRSDSTKRNELPDF